MKLADFITCTNCANTSITLLVDIVDGHPIRVNYKSIREYLEYVGEYDLNREIGYFEVDGYRRLYIELI